MKIKFYLVISAFVGIFMYNLAERQPNGSQCVGYIVQVSYVIVQVSIVIVIVQLFVSLSGSSYGPGVSVFSPARFSPSLLCNSVSSG